MLDRLRSYGIYGYPLATKHLTAFLNETDLQVVYTWTHPETKQESVHVFVHRWYNSYILPTLKKMEREGRVVRVGKADGQAGWLWLYVGHLAHPCEQQQPPSDGGNNQPDI